MIWMIEDDEENYKQWAEEVEGLVWYSSAYDAWQACGNPEAIIFDVGSIGLQLSAETYMSVYHQLRDRYPGVWIYLISYLPHLPKMIKEEVDDDLLVPVDMLEGFLEHWRKYK